MSIRAVILDVYNTILAVGPPPRDAEARWARLGQDTWNEAPSLSRAEFEARCETIITREQAAARAAGIPFPEIYWPAVATEALPELARLSAADLGEFLYRHAQTQRTLGAMPGAELLGKLKKANFVLGIVSNAQPYTLRELDAALAGLGLSRSLFDPSLCFWSFEAGFSKPDPHVFRWLTARLKARGIHPAEILIVGDRVDNDIEPARAQGWQTWHLRTTGPVEGSPGGSWRDLLAWLSSSP